MSKHYKNLPAIEKLLEAIREMSVTTPAGVDRTAWDRVTRAAMNDLENKRKQLLTNKGQPVSLDSQEFRDSPQARQNQRSWDNARRRRGR